MSKKLFNAPDVKLAIVAVSRDCFPESLSVNRRKALVKGYTEKYGADDIYECPICIDVFCLIAVEAVMTSRNYFSWTGDK